MFEVSAGMTPGAFFLERIMNTAKRKMAATGGMAQTQQADKDSQKFITAAIQGDISEIDVGKLAQEKGQSEAVKQYGAILVKDHGYHKAKAEEVASKLRVEPPTGSSIMQKATYAKLKLLSGATPTRHQGLQKRGLEERFSGSVGQGHAPTLQHHLKAAQSLERQTAQKQPSR